MRALRPLDANERLLLTIAAILALITLALHALTGSGGGVS
jgi:hypothetical protein